MEFNAGDKVVLVKEYAVQELGVANGDEALVLGTSNSGETLHVFFAKWESSPVPYEARRGYRLLKHGKPYYMFRAHRFIHNCMFNTGHQ